MAANEPSKGEIFDFKPGGSPRADPRKARLDVIEKASRRKEAENKILRKKHACVEKGISR